MRKIKKALGVCALAITLAMSSMTMCVAHAQDVDDSQVISSQDPVTSSDNDDDTNNDDNNGNDNTDNTVNNDNNNGNDNNGNNNNDAVNNNSNNQDSTNQDSSNQDSTDQDTNVNDSTSTDTREDVSIFITNNVDNNNGGTASLLSMDGSNDDSRLFKIVIKGGYFTPIYGASLSIKDGEDLTDWCNGTLSSGLTLNKYTTNNSADFGRFSINGTTSEVGNHQVVITIPKDRITAYNNYKISEDGLTVTFTVNVDGVSTTITVPVSAVSVQSSVEEDSHNVEDNDYIKFNKKAAATIREAAFASTVEISTDLYMSFTDVVFDAIEQRSDLTIKLSYVDKDGQKKLITMAPGTTREVTTELIAADVDDPNAVDQVIDPALNEDGNHYYGFHFLESVLPQADE